MIQCAHGFTGLRLHPLRDIFHCSVRLYHVPHKQPLVLSILPGFRDSYLLKTNEETKPKIWQYDDIYLLADGA